MGDNKLSASKKETFMKYLLFLLSGLVAVVLAVLTSAPALAQEKDFCWKDTVTRGVGEVPTSCGPGRERIGLLCYSACPANMARVGLDCHSVCPAGMRDDGLFCRAAEYGRGAGYVWEFGDPAFSSRGMFARCERDNGQGNCELDGAIVYPKCKPGYEKFGTNICRPVVPNCTALGMNPGIDLSCAKKVIVGDPVVGVCGSGQQMDAGLCYTSCPAGYDGVGPVCWGQAPGNWVNCGMGAAKDDLKCASVTGGQVAAVGEMAMFVASLGSSTSLTAGMKAPENASRLTKLKQTYSSLKVQFDLLRKSNAKVDMAVRAFDVGKETVMAGKQGYTIGQTIENAVTEEDMARAAAQIAAILDPSGVSSTVAAYTYPKCSKYGFTYEVAHGKPATQSTMSYGGVPALAVDGNIYDGVTTSHTANETNAWWQVDLEGSYTVSSINVWNRIDCCGERLSNFSVFVSDSDMTGRSYSSLSNDSSVWHYKVDGQAPKELTIPVNANGRYVRIQLEGTNYLSLPEVQVWAKY